MNPERERKLLQEILEKQWYLDGSLIDDKIYCYDKTKLIRKIYDDYIVYEYDGKPFLKIRRQANLD